MMCFDDAEACIRLSKLEFLEKEPEAFARALFEATAPDCSAKIEITLSTTEVQMSDLGTEEIARNRLKSFLQAAGNALT
ncbi:hypothetical protein IWQ51_001717 [Labrenzia sp. EL_142]|nr:hypothetical protein [Labrenzia sp. EL_142]